MAVKANVVRRGLMLVFAGMVAWGLGSCAQQNLASSGSSAQPDAAAQSESSTQSESAASLESSAQPSSTTDAQDAGELYGSPWVSSIFTGNLPEAAPEAADDLYLHYAYDYAAAHQDAVYASVSNDAEGELQAAVTQIIKDDSVASPELEQLRMFYNQAADLEAVEAAGADELRPYLKVVADTQSLDELEALLLSDDFPFSPWIDTTVSAIDMKSNMSVAVMPNMLFTNSETSPDVYQDAEDESTQMAHDMMKLQQMALVEADLEMVSIAEDATQAREIATSMFDLEKSYGKDDNPNQYQYAEYGAQTQSIKALSLDELVAACPNFPMRETLAKMGEDKTDTVIVMYPAWLSSFNDVWTEDNFELLRTMTEVKVLRECSAFLPPSFYAGTRATLAQDDPTADEFAYAACNMNSTFSQLLAKTYVEQELGDQAVSDLEKLTNDLIDAYIDLVGNTTWLNDQSRENVIDKIDNMALNILYPDGGYFDYSGLQLTPAEQGGTLLGNYLALKAYNDKCEAELVGQPARASATWLYARPTTQNCFYDAVSNSMNIFPGYATSVSYGKNMSSEELLAGAGFAIGHEISHAFDYTGSQFDAFGQPIAVFSDEDVQEYVAKRQGIIDYFSTIEVTPGTTVNGTIKSSEATADLCGMQVILERARSIDGFDYEKLFESTARMWATVYSPAYADLLNVDVHPLNNQRVNVSAQMFEEFYSTYGAAEGNAMYLAPEDRLAIWAKSSG